jgi:hypothetical protein
MTENEIRSRVDAAVEQAEASVASHMENVARWAIEASGLRTAQGITDWCARHGVSPVVLDDVYAAAERLLASHS